MSYIGNTSTTQAFTPAVDFFNGNGSTTAFTLSRPVASVAQVQAVISNVPQKPGDAFTVSGNTITFTSAPPSGTQNIYVYYTSPITQVIAPGQNTVTTTSLMDGSVTPAKLSTGAPAWDASGNFGIGTSSPVQRLDVVSSNTDVFQAIRSTSSSPTNVALRIQDATTGTSNGDGAYLGRASSVNYLWTYENEPWVFGTNSTERMRINAGAPILCLSGGNTSATGTGIAFPATQSASSDANTLDDYEEGTVSLGFGSRTATGTWSTISASYTKVGRLVTVRAYIAGTSMAFAGATAYAYITGLPFSGAPETHMGVFGTGAISATGLIGAVYVASTDAILYGANTTSAVSGINFSVTYQNS